MVSSLRGVDSTGVFQIAADGSPYTYKLPHQASVFIQDKHAKAFIRDTNRSVMTVCHVRAATEGTVSLSNAHPFEVGVPDDDGRLVIGVHNGTLQGWRAHKEAKHYDVDSEWGLSMIAKEGHNAFASQLRGAYSFVWWDNENPMRLWFARNAERPLALVRTKNKKHIMFASEPEMLALLTKRNGIDIEDTVYITGTHQMYFVDVDKDELIIEPFSTKYAEPTGVVHTRPLVQRNAGGTNVTHILGDDDDAQWDWHGFRGHTGATQIGFFSRMDAWFASKGGTAETKDFNDQVKVAMAKNEELAPFAAPTAADRDDATLRPATEAYLAADKDNSILEIPLDYAEVSQATRKEYYNDLVDASESLEAARRGLPGTVVVFEASDSFTTDGVEGTIMVTPTDTHPAYGDVKAMGAKAIYLSTGDEGFNPTKNMYEGKSVVGVIAGVKELASGTVYLLSPLKANGHIRLREQIEMYLEKTGRSHKVPARVTH